MSPKSSSEMILDRVDENDHVVGTIARKDVFNAHASFRVAHVFLFNSAAELLLQRLALTRERNPGLWGSSVAAYLFAGETYADAARRRLREELGIGVEQLESRGKDVMRDHGSLKHIGLFTAHADGPFFPNRDQIAELRFVSTRSLRRQLDEAPDHFTPTFQEVFAFFLDHGGL